MLWEKEYVDLSESLKPRRSKSKEYDVTIQYHRKNEKTSLEKRKEGNVLFGERKWVKAMEKYNESLCFAESHKSISMAYANRASCFLRIGLCNECLIDIEMAKAANYPKDLMPKLVQREAACRKLLMDEVLRPDRTTNIKHSSNFGAKLSFGSHKQFPGMADVLKIDKDEQGDFCVIATENIDVGKAILVDEPFEKYLYRSYGRKCNICLKGNTNLKPCEKCSIALFCTDCFTKSNGLHEYECGISCSLLPCFNGNPMHLVRGILMAIQLFPKMDNLIEFVEQVIRNDRKEIPSQLITANSKYRAFLKLPMESELSDAMIEDFFMALEVLENISKLKETLKLRKHHNFLMHLLLHHVQVTSKNIYRKMPWWEDHSETVEDNPYYFGRTSLMHPYFQRSPAPNVLDTDCDGNSVYITVRPIRNGDRIAISNIGFLIPQSFGPPHMEFDHDYHAIEESYNDLVKKKKNDCANQAVIDKCLVFQRKYGSAMWNGKMQRIIEIFIMLTTFRFVNPVDEEGCSFLKYSF